MKHDKGVSSSGSVFAHVFLFFISKGVLQLVLVSLKDEDSQERNIHTRKYFSGEGLTPTPALI